MCVGRILAALHHRDVYYTILAPTYNRLWTPEGACSPLPVTLTIHVVGALFWMVQSGLEALMCGF